MIYITINGDSMSGKSTIAKIIANALNRENIACEVDDGTDGDYGKWQADKIEALRKQNILVKIKTTRAANRVLS
jgi:uridine kinase